MKLALYNVNVKLSCSSPILHLSINNLAMHHLRLHLPAPFMLDDKLLYELPANAFYDIVIG